MEKGEKLTGGPYWTQNWIEAMWRFTAERFVDFDTGTVDFEALGREEYEFRKALFFRNFKNSPRAREAFDAAADDYCKKVANGQKGGRPRKETTADAHTREDCEFKSDSGDAGNLESATSATIYGEATHREAEDVSTTFSKNMRRVPQNEAPAHGFSGGRTAHGTMSRSPEAAAQSGKASALDGLPDKDGQSAKTRDILARGRYAPPSCSPEDGNHYDQEARQVRTDEARESRALESRRTEGHSLRVGNVARPSVRSPGRKFRNKEEFIQWAIDDGLDPVDANECWEATMERGGKDADGNTVKNMKAFARQWCKTRAEKRRTA